MSDPTIAAKVPAVLDLEAGTYWWCRCGLSKNQPMCDGAHKGGSDIKPMQFELVEARKVGLCQCKRTGDPPFCDGTHKSL